MRDFNRGFDKLNRIAQEHRLGAPPRVLRRPGVRLDNVAIVPASLLPFKAQWQAVANKLPNGGVLIILPSAETSSSAILKQVAAALRAKGRPVTIISSKRRK